MYPSKDLYNSYLGIRVAVLGAVGFIGRWVAHELCARGANVILVDHNRADARKIFSKYTVHGEIQAVDLRDSDLVQELYQKTKPSITFNLAGYGVNRSQRNKEKMYQINSYLVQTICQAVSETRDHYWHGINLVHIGTAFEYGDLSGNLSEDSIPNPTTSYGKSKLEGTRFLTRFCKTHKIKGITARLFTVYGPGELPGRLLPSLFETAKTGKALKLTRGTQKRDFTYVGDVAEGLLRLGLAGSKYGEIVNLATGRLSSVRRFTELAAGILGISGDRLLFGAIPSHYKEMEHSEVDVSRLKQIVGWVPPTRIEEGIRKTMGFKRLLNSQGDSNE